MKFKFKFDLKLTLFLVSLFIGLLMLILGGKNKYCLSFGFMILGGSVGLLIWYNNDRIEKEISLINNDIKELNEFEEPEESTEEKVYILKELYNREKYLKHHKKRSLITSGLCSGLLILIGFMGLF